MIRRVRKPDHMIMNTYIFFLLLAKLSILHPLDHLPSRFAVRLQVLYRTYSCIEDCMSLRQDLMHRDGLIILTR